MRLIPFALLLAAAVAAAQTPTPTPPLAAPPAQNPPPAAAPPPPSAPATPPTPPAWARIPANAISSGILDGAGGWQWNHDPYTGGATQPTSNYPIYPDGREGFAGRQFVAPYSGGPHTGALWHLAFGADSRAQHFAYTAKVYLVTPEQIENVEMDMNQVMNDGRTVILALQCAGGSKTWEYTTVSDNATHWHPSNVACNPATWGMKKWHKVALYTERDSAGNVTYDGVCFDDNCQAFQGAAGPSVLALHWDPHELLLNYQTDAAQATGIMDSYLRDLEIFRW